MARSNVTEQSEVFDHEWRIFGTFVSGQKYRNTRYRMQNTGTSKTRKIYFLRLCGRVLVLLVAILVYIFDREQFSAAEGLNFFKKFSLLHILWGLWIYDMVLQLIPVKAHISIGSQKVFESLFRPIKERINYKNLKQYIKDTTASAYKVMIMWIILTAVVSGLFLVGVIDTGIMVLLSTFFYVCDLICVLIWCPFRLIMKNKCCTTCRIFNWDHLMMFLPIVSLHSFYSWSLVIFAFIIWLIWEVCVFTYPERFWENSNMALRCSECTDKLCTQYCRKLRGK
ncbi:MAG: hypothetical protein IJW06_04810 [Clostridia bacterium]|nr:hypothetical protein [Clostridia bacterium]